MTIKLISSPNKNKLVQHRSKISELSELSQSPLSGGMITSVPAVVLDNNQSPFILNYNVLYGRTCRRFGLVLFIAKPNSNKILGLALYDKSDGTTRFVRFTKNSVHTAGVSSWTVITGPALLGTDDDWFHTINVDDRLLFSNGGVNPIQEIDTVTNTYAALGNAGNYKYLATFGDRVLGLFGMSPFSPTQIAWSGNRNYAEWDPLVDPSAGFTSLVNTGTDLTDPITGALVLSNILIIFRYRSIWEATLTNSYSQPYYFTQKIPGIGCDCPQSIAKAPASVCFVDTFGRGVYHLTASGELTNIGEPVIKDLMNSITNKNSVIGTYANKYSEYLILISNASTSITRVWKYNFKSGTWVINEYSDAQYINYLEFATGSLTIDELLGTIDDLLGTIDNLGSVSSAERASILFVGNSVGEIFYESDTSHTDADDSYTSLYESKVFELPVEAEFVVELNVEFQVKSDTGNVTLEYRKDNNVNWSQYKTSTWTVVNDDVIRVIAKKNTRCRNYQFRIKSDSGLFELIKYSIKIDRAGEAKR